jgi:predicted outer membrane repeat protein
MNRVITIALLVLALGLLTHAGARPVYAADQQVINCANDTELRSDLAAMQGGGGGGTLTFACQMTITISSQLPEITTNTIIDGENKVALTGLGSTRLLGVGSMGILTLRNITLESGYAGDALAGGAVLNYGQLKLIGATIRNNGTPFNGGAIRTYGPLTVENTTFFNNKATNGGAIFASAGSTVNVNTSKFDANIAGTTARGGAIYGSAKVEIDNSEFLNNSAGSGGAVALVSTTQFSSIEDSFFHHNLTTGIFPNANGSALLLDAAPAQVIHSTFQQNNGQSGTLATLPGGQLNISYSTLHDNTTNNGGGIYNKGTANVFHTTLSFNFGHHGGGINNLGSLLMMHSTLSGNAGTFGGGLKTEGGTATLYHITFAKNSAGDALGGGIYTTGANTHLSLYNVIVALSPNGGNCDFNVAPDNVQSNLSSDTTCNFGAGDGVNIKLGPLETNGGFTLTHRLPSGSLAINAGTPSSATAVDQRDFPRPQGGAVDVGAVEFQPCSAPPPKPPLVAPVNSAKVTTPQVVLDWAGPDCVGKFSVIVRRDSKTGLTVFTKDKIKATQVTTTALARNKTYFWQVTGCFKGVCTTSVWGKFKVK